MVCSCLFCHIDEDPIKVGYKTIEDPSLGYNDKTVTCLF